MLCTDGKCGPLCTAPLRSEVLAYRDLILPGDAIADFAAAHKSKYDPAANKKTTMTPAGLLCYITKYLNLADDALVNDITYFTTTMTMMHNGSVASVVILSVDPGVRVTLRLTIRWTVLMRNPMVLQELRWFKFRVAPWNKVTRFGVKVPYPTLVNAMDVKAEKSMHDVKPDDLYTIVTNNWLPVLAAVASYLETKDADAYATATRVVPHYMTPAPAAVNDVVAASEKHLRVKLRLDQVVAAAWALDRERLVLGTVAELQGVRLNDKSAVRMLYGDAQAQGTRTPVYDCVSRISGGFLAQEMGVGKTLTVLALLLAGEGVDPSFGATATFDDEVAHQDLYRLSEEDVDATPKTNSYRYKRNTITESTHYALQYKDGTVLPENLQAGGTLIVVPLSLLEQWRLEIAARVQENHLRVVVYHGPDRRKTCGESVLAGAHVVLTTYETLSRDMSLTTQAAAEGVHLTWACNKQMYYQSAKTVDFVYKGSLVPGDVVLDNEQTYIVGTDGKVYYFQLEQGSTTPSQLFDFPPLDEYLRQRQSAGTGSPLSDFNYYKRIGKVRECTAVHSPAAANSNRCVPHCNTCGSLMTAKQYGKFLEAFHRAPVSNILWHRIVLDESQKVQGTSTVLFKALRQLVAKRRWCVSGTPISKEISSLDGQLHFLGGTMSLTGSFSASPWLDVLTSAFVRFEKKDVLTGGMTLPPVTTRVETVALGPALMATYNTIARGARTLYETIKARNAVNVKILDILRAIGEVRHACAVVDNHAGPTATLKTGQVVTKLPPVPADAIGAKDECAVCLEVMVYPIVLPCRHCFCVTCVPAMLDMARVACPLCKMDLHPTQTKELDTLCHRVVAALEAGWTGVDPTPLPAAEPTPTPPPAAPTSTHPKFALLQRLLAERAVPTLVFTQFDDSIVAMKRMLTAAKIPVFTMHGSMSRKDRAASIVGFTSTVGNVVLVLSLQVAAFGLNLVHAQRVLFMEPAMNPSLEAQAIGRVHRMGQVNPVEIVYVIATDTVEERVREHRVLDTTVEDRAVARCRQLENLLM
jgi:hypothetical protein